MKRCVLCGKEQKKEWEFCFYCGEPHRASKEGPIGENDFEPDFEYKTSFSDINHMCFILLIGCAILWLVAPFVAINLLTLGDQPTALQIVTDDILYIGDLFQSPVFWAAIVSGICIIICFVATVKAAYPITRCFAFIAEIPMALTMIEMFLWADDLEELFEALGLGFWGIFISLAIVAFARKADE